MIVSRWTEDKPAAYSVVDDYSLRSKLYFPIPEMDKRGCGPGTF